MKQYDKKEYFIRSRYRFKERAFVLKLFCVTFNLIELEVKDEDLENGNFFIITDELKDLQVNDLLIVKNNKYKFYAFLNTVSEINSKSTYNIQILEEFKELVITSVISLITGIIAFFAGKRKSTADIEITETDVIKSIRELYTGLVEDMKLTVDELKLTKTKVLELSSEIDSLRTNVGSLEKDYEEFYS